MDCLAENTTVTFRNSVTLLLYVPKVDINSAHTGGLKVLCKLSL